MEPTTLAHLLADPASAEPAIIDEAAAITISYRALADQVERTARALRGTGLSPGDTVALVIPNSLALLVLSLAVARAGLIAAPLNPTSKAGELRGFITDVDARAIVTGDGHVPIADATAGLAVPIWTSSLEPSGEVRLTGI